MTDERFWRELPIPRRNLHFDLGEVDLRHWHPAGPHASHFLNVQSCLFPQGEQFFIRSVRRCAADIDDARLKAQVRGFIGQEAVHGREHAAYNQALAQIGYRVEQTDRWLAGQFALMERWLPAKFCLAITVALEHLTAITAAPTLANPDSFKGAPPVMAALWRWHAAEETEHKAVAFDVYQQVAGSGFRAWLRRVTALLLASVSMQVVVMFGLLRVAARERRLLDLRGWWGLLRELWIDPGVYRRQVPAWFSFFRPGFHPWDHDNRVPLAAWQQAGAGYEVAKNANP